MDPLLGDALPLLVWAIFAASAALTVSLGGLLAYHWFRYAMNPAAAFLSLIVYASVSCVLLSGLLAATISIAAI